MGLSAHLRNGDIMKLNSTNQIAAGEVLFKAGEHSDAVYMVLKGKLELRGRGLHVTASAGSLIGMEQACGDAALYTCAADEPASVYAVAQGDDKSLLALLNANKDYNGIVVYNQVRILNELAKQLKGLGEYNTRIYDDLKADYDKYISIAKQGGCRANMIPEISQLAQYVSEVDVDIAKLSLYQEYVKIPYDTVKAFYAPSTKLAVAVIRDMTGLIGCMMEACDEMSDYLTDTFALLMGNEECSLYRNMLTLGIDLKKAGADTSEIDANIEKYNKYLSDIKALIGPATLRPWNINEAGLKEMSDVYAKGGDFRTEDDEAGAAVDGAIADTINALANSFEQLLEYAEYPEDKTKGFAKALDGFVDLPDRESADDDARQIRKVLTEHFYELYALVFHKYAQNPSKAPKVAELMLDYGYLSERLLKDDQMIGLLRTKPVKCDEPCVVFTMKEWLLAVYRGEKEPSKNDLGQDYTEALREMRKTGQITEAEEKELTTNIEKKLEHEIRNVMLHAMRVVNGQLLTCIPVLHSEQFIGDVEKAYSAATKINESVKNLLSIDFSVFHRETLYVNEAAGIEREWEMKKVLPVFVLYPTVGENVIMWQEITGRKRDSEGRFFAPAFSYKAMDDMMMKAFGQFRWALCKTIQGTNWNNIQVRSLTSEYSDYIQFYRKNHDLSDEAKEKIKLQIQRGRNNLREIFTQDYVVWMKAEAAGAIRLNKIAREMLATYCPFAAELKQGHIRQPIFEDAFARNTRERNKKTKELELRYKALEAKGVELPAELTDTLVFYRDM